MTDDEVVVGAVFKHSSAYEENNIHSNGTPINKYIKEKSVSVEGDNINVVNLDAVTPTTTSLKRPIEIVPPLNRLNALPQKMVLLFIPLRFQKWKNSNKFSSYDYLTFIIDDFSLSFYYLLKDFFDNTSEMTHNSDIEFVIDKLADIDSSKESWNIRVQVVMIWKQTYQNNSNMVSSLDMILMDQENTCNNKKNLINAFQALLEEGVVRQITNFGMRRNEGDYMLVAHRHKINFYKTTTIRVSTPFVDRIDPFNFVSFHDLTAINFDTRVAFDFIGQVVSTEPMRVIKKNARETRLLSIVAQDMSGRKMQVALWDGFALKLNSYISEHQNENALVIILLRMAKLKTWGGQPQVGNCLFGLRLHINDDMHHISKFKKAIADIDLNVESSINTTQLNTETVVTNPEDYYLCFPIKDIDDIPDYNEVRVVIRVQDETGSASFVLFDRHVKDLIHRGNHWLMEKISKDQGRQKIPDEFNTMLNRKFVFKVYISKFNLENNYHAYTVHKMTDDEVVVGAVFKHSSAYEENNIHSNGTPINKYIKEKSVSVEGDNINVVNLDAVTPTTTSLKRPIEIVPPLNRLNALPQKMVLLFIPLRFQKWKNSNKFSSYDYLTFIIDDFSLSFYYLLKDFFDNTSEMTHNSDIEFVIDKLADIDSSKESWNIRVQVVMIWKQTYQNNSNMVSSLDMILMDQENTCNNKKNLINAFQALLEEGAVRQITNFGMRRNEGDYMLVAHRHKINFYKTTTIRVSTPFVDRIDPFNFVRFHDLTARNFDTRVAFDFIGQVVSTEPMRVIKKNARETRLLSIVAQDMSGRKMQVALWDGFALKLNSYISEHQNENALVIILLRMAKLKTWGGQPQVGNCLFGLRLHINDDMHHISKFKKAIADIDLNVESSINTTQLNTETVVTNPEDYYLCFPIKDIDDIPDYNEVRVVIRVQDETGSASFVLFDRHVKDLIHRGNHWLMEKISKDQGRQKIPDEFNTMLNRKLF
ncbi:unnamed protein product [Lactuca virosa]|uniref:Replication protein A 70 kDa DNA-binding subunit B/D first OB fold domain-containing protein n=2 Tax=Lactuca virosa TaxID=75947 RepID=A0AAU9PUB4_9ASTR|nr:unnamed protein product [Lactuca virosa]